MLCSHNEPRAKFLTFAFLVLEFLPVLVVRWHNDELAMRSHKEGSFWNNPAFAAETISETVQQYGHSNKGPLGTMLIAGSG